MFVISSFIVVPFLQKKQLHLASPEPPRAPTWKKDPMLGQPRTVSRMAWNFSSGFSPVHMALSKNLWLKSLWENKQFGSNSFPSYPIQKETMKKMWFFWHGVQHKSNQQLVRIAAPIYTNKKIATSFCKGSHKSQRLPSPTKVNQRAPFDVKPHQKKANKSWNYQSQLPC